MMNTALDRGVAARTATAPSAAPKSRDLPPVLLADATWYGTLAAARDLGSRGVPVTLACDRILAPARWSRHVSRTVRCPATADAQRFLDWLHAFAAREPGHVFHPTSDDTAWLACAHRTTLEPHLRTYLPSLRALAHLLDKWSLGEAARGAGIGTPETWCPRDAAELERLAREVPFPVVVKPRMQVLSDGMKGTVVRRREELLAAWLARRDSVTLHDEVARHVPDAALPLVQAFRSGTERIYTVDGFVTEDGELTTLGCTKLLQLPRGAGPGIAFEATPVEPALAEALRRLLRNVGFVGVFDAEFVAHEGRQLLIDLNPRFYNHMAFEVDRGMPLPWMAYLAALGDRDGLGAEIRASRAASGSPDRVYAHRNSMRLLLAAQRLAGAMSRDEVRAWRRWIAEHAGDMTDPAWEESDRRTELADGIFMLHRVLRHPRSSIRSLVRSSSGPPAAGATAPTPRR